MKPTQQRNKGPGETPVVCVFSANIKAKCLDCSQAVNTAVFYTFFIVLRKQKNYGYFLQSSQHISKQGIT